MRELGEDRLPADERRRVVRHLLSACPSCLSLARQVLAPELASVADYDGVFRRLGLAWVLARNDVQVEKGIARALWEGHLAVLEPGRRLMAIRLNPDLQTWGTFDLLVGEAKRIALERPVEAVDLAYAALAVTDLTGERERRAPPGRVPRRMRIRSGRAGRDRPCSARCPSSPARDRSGRCRTRSGSG